MENQLTRLGQLLITLKKKRSFDFEVTDLEYLNEEVSRVRKSLMESWKLNSVELPYLLAFHLAESQRLHESILDADLGLRAGLDLEDHQILNVVLFHCLRYGLSQILNDLKMLIEGAHIALDLSDNDS